MTQTCCSLQTGWAWRSAFSSRTCKNCEDVTASWTSRNPQQQQWIDQL